MRWLSLLLIPIAISLIIGENYSIKLPLLTEDAIKYLESLGYKPLLSKKGYPIGYFKDGKFLKEIKVGDSILGSYFSNNDYEMLKDIVFTKDFWSYFAKNRMEGWNFDEELLKTQDYLEYEYIKRRYGSIENFVREFFKGREKFLLDYIKNYFEISPDYDLLNIVDALKNKKIGYSHLYRILKEFNYEIPDWLEEYLKDLPKKIKIDEETLKKVFDYIIKNNEEMFYNIARKYMRELAKSGELDKIRELIDDPNIKRAIEDEIKERFWEKLSLLQKYFPIFAATIFLTLLLYFLKI